MKTTIKIILIFLAIIFLFQGFGIENSSAGWLGFEWNYGGSGSSSGGGGQGVIIPNVKEIKDVSIAYNGGNDWIVGSINALGFSILRTIKLVLQGVLLIYVVYIGAQMVWSMGTNEDELGKAKTQIRYIMVALLFISIPGSIYRAFRKEDASSLSIDGRVGVSGWTSGNNEQNMFFDFFSFGQTLNDNILGFLKVMIFGIAVFMIIYEGIKVMTARGRDEQISEAKNKIIYSLMALIFLGFIEVWKNLAFSGNIGDGVNIVGTMMRLALFFAGPTAIFFLTLAGYYYITSQGDEEKVKKAKMIIISIVMATVLLLASYTFLLDLATL
jgi:Type IV secretion system pilin